MNIDQLLDALKSLLPTAGQRINLHEPVFEGNEWAYVKECLDTGWVSSVGKFVDRFEQELAAYTGAGYAVATVNGTAALHVALIIAGVKAGDEVIIPTMTFVATANAVAYCGAVPHFADSEERTLGLDPAKLGEYLSEIADIRPDGCFNKKTGRCIRAVVPMHTFGHPVNLDPLLQVCQRFNIVMIEDAAESLGSFYKGIHTGNHGLVSTLSFNGNKIVTTGGGGALITNDKELAVLAKHLTTTAKPPHPWSYRHDMIGYNYRLPNLNAALGTAQLEKLPEFIEKKRNLADRYAKALSGIEGIRFFTEPSFASSNYWLNVLLLEQANPELRDNLLKMTHEAGILTRPAWVLMHRLTMYADCPHMDLSVAEDLENRLINLPSSVFL
ncbi:MAG: LegC family aminotransferase [Solirubrobacterales bacterium]